MNTKQFDDFLIKNHEQSRAWLAANSGKSTRAVNERQVKLKIEGRVPSPPEDNGLNDLVKSVRARKPFVYKKAQPKGIIRISTKLEKILLIPDCHFPYQDSMAFDLMMAAAKDFAPDHVVIMGDFIDMYSVSDHDKNPKRAGKLEEEITASVDALWRVKGLGAKNNVYISGNHEDRLSRYLMRKAPELWERITIPSVLALDKLGFQYIPYRSHYQLGKLYMTHDTGKAGVNAHKQALDAYHRSVVIGHTHRIGYIIQGDADGDKHVGAMFGWLGDVKQVDYMHNINAIKDWTLGFGIGYLDPTTGYVYLTPVPIVKYSCVVEGKKYSS